MAQVNGIAVGAIGVGVVLLWSGLQNKSITTTIQDIVSGRKPVPGPKPVNPLDDANIIQNLTPGQQQQLGDLGGNPRTAPGVSEPASVQKNQAIAKLLAAAYGWSSGPNWDALVTLWNSESGWNNTIWNTTAPCGSSGAHAYGIPQACGHGPASSLVKVGTTCPYPLGNPGNPPECGGISSATAQIAWGLAYIKANYGQPVNVPLGGY